MVQATINGAAFIGLSGDFKRPFYEDLLFESQYAVFTLVNLYLIFWNQIPDGGFFKEYIAPLLNVI